MKPGVLKKEILFEKEYLYRVRFFNSAEHERLG